MYCLFLEIEGLRQLSRIRPATSDDLSSTLQQILLPAGASLYRRDGNFLLYLFPKSREGDQRQIIDAAFLTHVALQGWTEELIGYNLIIDYLNSDPETAYRRLRQAVSRLPDDQGVWVGMGAGPAVLPEVNSSGEGEYRLVENSTRAESRGLVGVDTFLRHEECIAGVLDQIEPWINGEDSPGVVLIRSDDRVQGRVNAEHVVRAIYGNAAERRIVALFPSEREDQVLAPMANAVCAATFPSIRDCLHGFEQQQWDECSRTLGDLAAAPCGTGVYDNIEADVLTAFGLYLRGTFRALERELLPAVIILENIDLFSVQSVRLFRRAYDRISAEFSPILIACSSHTTIPVAFADLPAVVVSLRRAASAEVADYADRYLSESAKRSIRIADCVRRTKGVPTRLYHHFVCIQDSLDHAASTRVPIPLVTDAVSGAPGEGVTGEAVQPGSVESAALIDRLHQDEREILAIAALLGGRVPGSVILLTASRLSFDGIRVRQVARRLYSLGLVRDPDSMYVEMPDVRESCLSALGGDRTGLVNAVSRTLLSLVDEGEIRLTRALLPVVCAGSGNWLPALRCFLRHALDGRRFDRVLPVIADAARLKRCTDEPGLIDQILYVAELRLALLTGSETDADRLFADREGLSVGLPFEKSVAGDVALEHCRYVVAKGNQVQGRALCKRAIMLFQDADDAEGVRRANLEFGSLLLAQEHVSDARDYFLMTRPPVGSSHYGYDSVRGVMSELACLFLSGTLTRVREQCESLRIYADQLGLRDVILFLELLQARVDFELGHYQSAAARFERGLCDSAIYAIPAAGRVFRAWTARCLVYLGDPVRGLRALGELPSTEEVRFFRAEAYERQDMPHEALRQLDDQEPSSTTVFRSPEQVRWESGFAQVEDRALGISGGDRVLVHLIKSFGAYLTAINGDVDEGIALLHRLTRQEKVSNIDPYNRLYYYLYSEILPRSKSPDREDYLTILGKSVKYMQERNSRLDEYRDKTSFLSANHWNRLLIEAARTHNLL